MNHTAAPQILIVDDEPHIAEVIRLYLEHAGFVPHHVERGEKCWRRSSGCLPI
ncbi:hypothetical protein LJK88_29580 [Paenibacillus sp. P26]|nr:hypothetical protein LJK88_29580 [Paenibacillus sp. P26]